VHALGAVAAGRCAIAEIMHQNVPIFGDSGGGGANGGASPWHAFRLSTPPLGKGQGPWLPRKCSLRLKTRCLNTPTGAQHNRTPLLLSLLHRYYSSAILQTYIFILSCPQPGLLLVRRLPPIPRRRLQRLLGRVHANTGHPVLSLLFLLQT
jgi:hypothetical protein